MTTEDKQARKAAAKRYLLDAQQHQPLDTEAVWVLARDLIGCDEFGLARRLLDKLVELQQYPADSRQKLIQKRALATYKDVDLNRDRALTAALQMLDAEFDLARTRDQETLGLAGAISKRRWEIDGNKLHLEQSLNYYRRGHELGMQSDGYTAINASFVQDLLASLEEQQAKASGASSQTAKFRREDARGIREAILQDLQGGYAGRKGSALVREDYWAVATLAEACLGLERYTEAKAWLAVAGDIPGIAEWERQSTALQLVKLVQLQPDYRLDWNELEKSEAWQALIDFLGQKAEALRTLYQGKVGLALSGGGFRASLYHIGVLARMAELDLLRHVEILSCVSGGSIIGAHYYLELRRLFNKDRRPDTGDNRIGREDYIRIVEHLVQDFTAGVQENPRVRILANPWHNLKMIFSPSYSRTQRLGELYEELIYSRVQDGEGEAERWLNDLYIKPVDEADDFKPRRDNWRRRCKVPELVLNATTLNSGHNWQFTASWMGESPVAIDTDVDSNSRYRRLYYPDAPEAHKRVRLGTAVGASSCVPGLFEPIILRGLYEGSTVRLVDGGVYDNQGVASLLEQECNHIVISDAVGQMNSDAEPVGGILSPLLRSNSIMMHRVRGAQYEDLKARSSSGLLKGFAYMHLKQGLESKALNWAGADEPEKEPADKAAMTFYGIRKDIQELLAGVRTDLDSFSDLEAYALMASGYLAAEQALHKLEGLPMAHDRPAHAWRFLELRDWMQPADTEDTGYRRLLQHLEAANMTFFKVWKLSRPLQMTAWTLGLLLLAGVICLGFFNPHLTLPDSAWLWLQQSLTLGNLLLTAGVLLFGMLVVNLVGKTAGQAMKLVRSRETLYRILVGLGVGIVGWVGALIHLRLFDRLFKRLGRLET